MDIRTFQTNRSQFPVDKLLEVDRRWVAFSADGSRIVASAERLDDLERKLAEIGEDPEQVAFEWIEFEDTALGGVQWL